MELKYFMDELNKPAVLPNNNFIDIDYFDTISDDKKELLKSALPYLSEESFTNIKHIYNDFVYPIEDTGFIQCLSEDNKTRLMVPIRLSWQEGESYTSPTIVIDEDNFNKECSKYQKIGSQNYTSLSIERKINSQESGYIKIFYTDDGHVFLNSDGAVGIAYKSVEELGKQLALVCKYRDQGRKTFDEHCERIMRKNYRHGK